MPLKYSCSAHTAQNCWLWMTWDSLWRVLPNSLMRKGFHWTFGGLVIAHAISSGLGWVLSTFHLYIFLRTLWLGCGSVCTIMTCGKPSKFVDAIVQRLCAANQTAKSYWGISSLSAMCCLLWCAHSMFPLLPLHPTARDAAQQQDALGTSDPCPNWFPNFC